MYKCINTLYIPLNLHHVIHQWNPNKTGKRLSKTYPYCLSCASLLEAWEISGDLNRWRDLTSAWLPLIYVTWDWLSVKLVKLLWDILQGKPELNVSFQPVTLTPCTHGLYFCTFCILGPHFYIVEIPFPVPPSFLGKWINRNMGTLERSWTKT